MPLSATDVHELNILLLGETGVGKSSFINSLLNYLTHESLSNAMASISDVLHLIPTQFTITTSSFDEILVAVGDGDTESENVSEVGQSATQIAQIHSFLIPGSGLKINLIDTPGIGDSRGIIKDGENMESVMQTLRDLKTPKLHAVCILLKPNEARLTLTFRFCVQQLLGHLHRDAISNVLFCFTNTRGNFYRPGESLKALRELIANNLPERSAAGLKLNSETIFCYDSEAFRYLAAVSNGVEFTEEESQCFAQSWKKSSDEAKRMVEQIKTLPSHDLTLTLDLFELRRNIDAITKPVVDLKKKLQVQIENLESAKKDKSAQIGATVGLFPSLVKDNTIVVKVPATKNLVCSHEDCCEGFGVEKSTNSTHYKSSCHSPCTCPIRSQLNLSTLNEAALLACKVLENGTNCTVCTHPWQMHLMIDFKTRKETKAQFSPEGAADVLFNLGKSVWQEAQVSGQSKKVVELKKELATLQKITSNLVTMLQNSAIDDDNDAIEEYIDRLLRETKADDEERVALEELKAAYLFQCESLRTETTGEENLLDLNKMKDMLKTLVSLNISGDCLRENLNLVGEGNITWSKEESTNLGKDEEKCVIA